MTTSGRSRVKLDDQGLVTAICQDATTGRVLMVAHMSPEALNRTLKDHQIFFYSRSRQELWHKGATSGNYLHVQSAEVDCDGDVLLFQVKADGPACHTGSPSCFFTALEKTPDYNASTTNTTNSSIVDELFQVIQKRQKEKPKGSYTTSLFESGRARIAQKIVEEGGEVAIAGTTNDTANLPNEIADLIYHTLVLLADAELQPEDVWKELRRRRSKKD